MARTGQPYPAGIDCIWLAEDGAGQLGVFIPGGSGPIPTSVLVAAFMPIEDIEDEVLALPVVTRCARRAIEDHDDASFAVDLAERGFFVFDWTEVRSATGEMIEIYVQVAAPEEPLRARALRGNMILGSTIALLPGLRLAEAMRLDIAAATDCERGD